MREILYAAIGISLMLVAVSPIALAAWNTIVLLLVGEGVCQ